MGWVSAGGEGCLTAWCGDLFGGFIGGLMDGLVDCVVVFVGWCTAGLIGWLIIR